MDSNRSVYIRNRLTHLVPIALGKHSVPCRTRQLSRAAAIILSLGEGSTVPNYIKAILIGWLLSFYERIIIVICLSFYL